MEKKAVPDVGRIRERGRSYKRHSSVVKNRMKAKNPRTSSFITGMSLYNKLNYRHKSFILFCS